MYKIYGAGPGKFLNILKVRLARDERWKNLTNCLANREQTGTQWLNQRRH